ncbi:MAG TPA: hypothetical protein VFU86_17355 [Terriglobales bacterium]|nr:hypothetical protein [Terriglobales bacterium]
MKLIQASHSTRNWFLISLLTFVFALGGLAQEPQHTPPDAGPVKVAPAQQPGTEKVSPPPQEQTITGAEHHLTQAEAEKLFQSLDEILQFVSKDTGLPIKEPIKRRLVTREQVGSFLEKRMKEDKDAEKLEKSETSLKKFRLLPKDFDLRSFMLTLMKEQVAGYYDPKTKTVNLLDWVDAEEQKPVMAHELTHALQDQSFGMEKWMEAGGKPKNIQEEIEQDERRGAREAVIEGQGMIVLVDYMLRPYKIRVTEAPQFVGMMRAGMGAGTDVSGSPVFSNAPLFLRDSLMFPYSSGMDFILQVELKRGTEAGFAGLLQTPPTTTRNILEPQTYLSGETIPSVKVADLDKVLGKSWQRWDYGFMGEYDVELMFKQWLNAATADAVSPSWRGGYYLSYKKPGTAVGSDGKLDAANMALVYVSKWASSAAAKTFADDYAKALDKRYSKVTVTKPMDASGGQWMTEEGPVVIDLKGDAAFVGESFEPAMAEKLRDAAFAEMK